MRASALALSVGSGATSCTTLLGVTDVPLPVEASVEAGMDAGATLGDSASAVDATAPVDASTPLDAFVPDATLTDADADAATDAGAHADADADAKGDARDAGTNSAEGAPPCDTQNDTHNCGACGHDCLGGACAGGICQPVTIYPADGGAAGQPWDMAQDATFLYWIDIGPQRTVRRTNKTTGDTVDLLSSVTTIFPSSISVDDGGAMFWGDQGAIWRCPKTGCTHPVSVVSTGINGAVGLTVDDVAIYWSENTTQLLTAHKYGTGEIASVLWQSDASTATTEGVATDGERVYFTADDGLLRGVAIDSGIGFAIGSAPRTDGGPPSVGITLNGGVVYWTILDPAHGQVLGASTSSLSPFGIAVQQQYPSAVAADGTSVYWINQAPAGGGEIYGCAVASCTPALLWTSPAPRALLVDDIAIYWTESASLGTSAGAIHKLAK